MTVATHHDSTEASIISELPALPQVIRYYDNFSDGQYCVLDPDQQNVWALSFDGRVVDLDFTRFHPSLKEVIRNWCGFILCQLSPVTVHKYFEELTRVPQERVLQLLLTTSTSIRSVWRGLLAEGLPDKAYPTLKSILNYMCKFSLGSWNPNWIDLLSRLPLPKVDKYAAVRVGDVFLTVEEEATLVQYIDDLAGLVRKRPSALSDSALRRVAVVVCSYQYGLRAKQIAMLKARDVRVWDDGLETAPAVHLTFTMIKQRSAKRVFPLVRRVKREWSTFFVELLARRTAKGLASDEHLFGCTPSELSKLIGDTTQEVLNQRRTLTELRHTAAQRLVDGGANEEELASFLGHTELGTGLIYFRASASQAERVNRALGISPTYQRVAKIAREGFISPKDVQALKAKQQIGGAPHGIPITGIGGCSSGQPACPYNPISVLLWVSQIHAG